MYRLLNIPPLIITFLFQTDKGMRDVLQSDELFDCKQVNYLLPTYHDFLLFFSDIDFFCFTPKLYIPSTINAWKKVAQHIHLER